MSNQQALERLEQERHDLADTVDERAGGAGTCAPALAAISRGLRDDDRVVDAPTLAAVRAFLAPDSPLRSGDLGAALVAAADLERRVYGIARPRAMAATARLR